MIKVLKSGTKEFIGKCSKCGCEFSYELSDLMYGQLSCPECKESYYHPNQGATTNCQIIGADFAKEPDKCSRTGNGPCDNQYPSSYCCEQDFFSKGEI